MVILESVVNEIKNYCTSTNPNMSRLRFVCEQYMKNEKEYIHQNVDVLAKEAMNIMFNSESITDIYYIFTFLLEATNSIEIYKLILKYCMIDDDIQKETRFFLYYQLIQYSFMHPEIKDEELENLFDDLYTLILEEYRLSMQIEKKIIPIEDRDKEFVLVIISQMLNLDHAPTKTLLDRCCVLEERLAKRVLIINTAEFVSGYKYTSVFSKKDANYIEDYCDKKIIQYKNHEFEFYQCKKNMPNVEKIGEIISFVKERKPLFTLVIGGNSITADLISNYVPTLTVATVFSGRTQTRGQFQTIGRSITNSDRKWLQKHNYSEEHIIESMFTFRFKEQTHTYSRKDMGLQDDRFVVVLVGGRLDGEIDDDCMMLIKRLAYNQIHVAFMGYFYRYEEYAREDLKFAEYSTNLGFQKDALAVVELCDVYLNPKRVGGGSAAAEAMYKGLPPISFDFGDTGVVVGTDFHINSYEEAYEEILRLKEDRDYYQRKSKRAKERAQRLTDSDTEFVNIIKKMEKRKAFY